MDEQNTRLEAKWHVNDIIRNKHTGKPYLVLFVSQRVYSTVIDLQSPISPTPLLTLLPRDFNDYTADVNMEVKKNNKWEYNFVQI